MKKRKNLIFIVAAVALGLIIGNYLVNKAKYIEQNRIEAKQQLIDEIYHQRRQLLNWENDSLDMGLSDDQIEIFAAALEKIDLVQQSIRRNHNKKIVLSQQRDTKKALAAVMAMIDYRYINWKNGLSNFEDRIWLLQNKIKLGTEDDLGTLYAINNIRKRYLCILMPKD